MEHFNIYIHCEITYIINVITYPMYNDKCSNILYYRIFVCAFKQAE